MSFEEINLDKPEEGNIEKRKKVLSRSIRARFSSYLNDVKKENKDLSKQEIIKEGLSRLIKRLKETIPEKDQEISELADSLFAIMPVDDKEMFIEKTTSDIADFILSSFTLGEIEKIARRYATYDNKVLNRLVEYGVSDNIIHIHSPLTFIDNPLELRTLFLDALNKLAIKLKNDPELANIEKVTASSWIVSKAQRAFKDAGFTITQVDKEEDFGEAEISREKLIELYGK